MGGLLGRPKGMLAPPSQIIGGPGPPPPPPPPRLPTPMMFCALTVNVECMFYYRDSTEEVKRRTSEANNMLNTWKKCYFEVRGKIEASGRDQRWEFDRRKLFERTDYMSNICEDLYNVAQVREKYKQTNKKKGI